MAGVDRRGSCPARRTARRRSIVLHAGQAEDGVDAVGDERGDSGLAGGHGDGGRCGRGGHLLRLRAAVLRRTLEAGQPAGNRVNDAGRRRNGRSADDDDRRPAAVQPGDLRLGRTCHDRGRNSRGVARRRGGGDREVGERTGRGGGATGSRGLCGTDAAGAPAAQGVSLFNRSGLAQRDAAEWFHAIAAIDREAARAEKFVAASIVLAGPSGLKSWAHRAAGRAAGVRAERRCAARVRGDPRRNRARNRSGAVAGVGGAGK